MTIRNLLWDAYVSNGVNSNMFYEHDAVVSKHYPHTSMDDMYYGYTKDQLDGLMDECACYMDGFKSFLQWFMNMPWLCKNPVVLEKRQQRYVRKHVVDELEELRYPSRTIPYMLVDINKGYIYSCR